jgi:tRNA (guanine-N7-)-methyltransferase
MPVDILIAQQLPWPVDWTARFGREAPLLVEVGFGGGHYLVDLARRRPDANIIGVEIANPSLRRTQDRLARHDPQNVLLVYGGAELFFWAHCPPASLAGVAVNFPDPWPKPAHHRRRLINDRFLALLATRMQPGGWLDVATDHPDYQPWIADHLSRNAYFDSVTGTAYVTRDDDRPRTKYERQALAAGVICHYYKYARNQTPVATTFPIEPELPMPNVIIESPLSLPEIQAHFGPSEAAVEVAREAADSAVRVRLMASYLGTGDGPLLVEAYISEKPMSQRVALQVQVREDGALMLSLGEIGFPRVTPGVHEALRHLTDWIVGLNPASRVRHHNLAPAD